MSIESPQVLLDVASDPFDFRLIRPGDNIVIQCPNPVKPTGDFWDIKFKGYEEVAGVLCVRCAFNDSRNEILQELEDVQDLRVRNTIPAYLEINVGRGPGWNFLQFLNDGKGERIIVAQKIDIKKRTLEIEYISESNAIALNSRGHYY